MTQQRGVTPSHERHVRETCAVFAQDLPHSSPEDGLATDVLQGRADALRGAQSNWVGHTRALMPRCTRAATHRRVLRVHSAKGVIKRYGPNEVDDEVSAFPPRAAGTFNSRVS